MSGGDLTTPYNPMVQGGMGGQDPSTQLRLCGVLPNTDFKPVFKMEELAGMQFLSKNMLRNEQMKMFLCMAQNCSHIPFGPLFADLWDKLAAGGKEIPNWAHDLIPPELRQAMSSEIHGEDASHMRSMIGNFAMQNAAMNSSSFDHDHGIG